jgi:hypothetical protein
MVPILTPPDLYPQSTVPILLPRAVAVKKLSRPISKLSSLNPAVRQRSTNMSSTATATIVAHNMQRSLAVTAHQRSISAVLGRPTPNVHRPRLVTVVFEGLSQNTRRTQQIQTMSSVAHRHLSNMRYLRSERLKNDVRICPRHIFRPATLYEVRPFALSSSSCAQ